MDNEQPTTGPAPPARCLDERAQPPSPPAHPAPKTTGLVPSVDPEAVIDHPVTAELAEASAEAAGVPVPLARRVIALTRAGGDSGQWVASAHCRKDPLEWYFPPRGGDPTRALARCATCTVRASCITESLLAGDTEGIFGTTAHARRRLRSVLRHSGLFGLVGEDRHLVWAEPGAERVPDATARAHVRQVRRPWDAQREAVDAICAALEDGGPAQIAMATGTGKTMVCLWSAERLGAHRVLILAPSLALVGQLSRVWRANWLEGANYLAVCSKPPDRTVRATTDPDTIVAAYQDAVDNTRPLAVFATYQSSAVLVTAGAQSPELDWDLAICDEAHHLAGRTDKPFAAVARGEIRARRRLYATATPRQFARRVAKRGTEEVRDLDHPVFGRRVYHLTLSQAATQGIVADYQVVVAAIERRVFARVSAQLGADCDPHLLAGAIAVLQTMARQRMRSCLSFHTRVDRAARFAVLLGKVAELLGPDDRPAGPGFSAWVDGVTPIALRDRVLARLENPVGFGVLASARALSEGLDIPSLDGIAVVDPKNSEVDVAQAVGRALRLPGGSSKVATVILPVLLTEPKSTDCHTPEGTEIDRRSLEIVSGALRALRSHDETLAQRLDHTRQRTGDPRLGRLAARAFCDTKVVFDVPGGATGLLADSMALHVVRETTAQWEEAFGRLRSWVNAHGTATVPQNTRVPMPPTADQPRSWGLGDWCSEQRTLHRRQLLAATRAARLEALPGWSWQPRTDHWWHTFTVLAEWVAKEQSSSPPQQLVVTGEWIGRFVNTARQAHRRGELSADKVKAFEELPAWSWNQRVDWWEEHFAQLAAYAAVHASACPSAGTFTDGFDIGRWVHKQRAALRTGKLTPAQAERLRALPGWVDHERDAAWEQNFAALARFMAAHRAIPSQSTVDKDGVAVGRWAHHQRARRDRLDPARVARLSELPGWSWDPRTNRWAETYAVLCRWVATHGNARVPAGTMVDGVALGAWVTLQRLGHRKHKLTDSRRDLLERLPGWSWSPHDARFEATLGALGAFIAREGHTRVPRSHVEQDIALGAWVARQRAEHRAGRLSSERAAALEALGFAWEP